MNVDIMIKDKIRVLCIKNLALTAVNIENSGKTSTKFRQQLNNH
jgi:hypothetical protein